MTIRVTGTDGSIFNFPDDTPEAEITSALDSHYSSRAAPAGPVEDVAKSFATNVVQGVAGTPGLPGDVQGLANAAGSALSARGLNPLDPMRSAADWAARQTVGRAVNAYKSGGANWSADTQAPVPDPTPQLPGSAQFQQAFSDKVLPAYQPQTMPGKIAATAGQMVGGGLMLPGASVGQKVFSGVAGGLGAEAAGRAAEGLGMPDVAPYASAAGAMLAPLAAAKVITPFRTDPARMAAAQRLRAEDIPVTAGQQTGSRFLQNLESTLAESPGGANPYIGQQEAFNAAVGRRMGLPAGTEKLSEGVMQGRAQEISQAYRQVLTPNPLQYDLPLGNDMVGTLNKYRDRVQLAQRPDLERSINTLNADIVANQGTLTGEQYQQARSFFAQQARDFRGRDSAYAQANKDIRNALDAAWERSTAAAGNQEAVAAKRELDRHYANQKTISEALASSPGRGLGDISPHMIGATARGSAGADAIVRGQSDLGSLANAAGAIMRQPPNSGTANRMQIMGMLSGAGGVGGFLAGGPIIGTGAAIAGAAAPSLVSQFVNRGLGQAYLSGRLPGQSLLNEGVLSGAQALINAQKGYESRRPRGILAGTR
jgi:hypothetical protein